MMSENGLVNGDAKKGVRYSPIRRRAARYGVPTAPACSFCRLCCVCMLVVLLSISVAGTIVLWATDMFDDAILQGLALRNNTPGFAMWQNPPVQPFVNVYVFNYTNAPQFLNGDAEKLHVVELGPFAFRQTMKKVNVEFTDNDTITFQDEIDYEFLPELSNGSLESPVTVINMPLLSAIAMFREKAYLLKMGANAFINSIKSKPFLNLSVNEFIWGYKESLTTLASMFSSFGINAQDLRLGFLEARSGLSKTVVTVNTGVSDINQLGIIELVDGEEELNAWDSSNCSRIDGTDGTLFPPYTVINKQPVHIFNKDMCRKLPLVFREDVMISGGIPARRYFPPDNVFGSAEENPDNACFCTQRGCPPSGVTDASPCAYGAPIMVSFPHFYLGDPELLEAVDGLKPEKSKHEMYLNIHPKLGVPLGGQTRFQFNVKVHKVSGFSQVNAFEDGVILPVGWMQVGVDELPPEVQELMYDATYTIKWIKNGFKYGLCVLSIFLAICLIYCLRKSCLHHRGALKDDHIMQPL